MPAVARRRPKALGITVKPALITRADQVIDSDPMALHGPLMAERRWSQSSISQEVLRTMPRASSICRSLTVTEHLTVVLIKENSRRADQNFDADPSETRVILQRSPGLPA